MRGVAILCVFYFHFMMEFSQEVGYREYQVLDTANQPFLHLFYTFFPAAYGATGVQLFLVISGFLIHYSFLRSGADRLDFRSFMARRFWRIYPPYLLALFFFTVYDAYHTRTFLLDPAGWWSVVSHVLLIHNLSDSTIYQINSSFWSLALEWQLYLIYPAFLWLSRRFGIRALNLGLIAFNLAYVVFWALIDIRSNQNSALMFFVLPNWCIWGLGAWMAENFVNGRRTFRISTPALLALTALYMAGKYFYVWHYFAHLGAALLWAMALEKYLWQPDRPNRWWESLLVPIGLCSYSFYLIHQPIVGPLTEYISLFGLSTRFRILTLIDSLPIIFILVLLSYSLYQWVELPSISFGKRWLKNRQKASPRGELAAAD